MRNCKKLVYTGMIDDKNNNLIDKYLGLANKQKIYYDMDDVKKIWTKPIHVCYNKSEIKIIKERGINKWKI